MGLKKDDIAWLRNFIKANPKARILTLGRQIVDGKKLVYIDEVINHNLIYSVDISHAEKPDYQADLCNTNFPSIVGINYDLIIDGGTLEHCSNVPVAMESISRCLKVGGTFLSLQQLNFAGHGFWNISPEYLYKWTFFNGYKDQRITIKRLGPFAIEHDLIFPPDERIEITSIVPLTYKFFAIKAWDAWTYTHKIIQAPPSKSTSFWKFWLWEARLFRH
jgi:SAM-dependent methyltransferase